MATAQEKQAPPEKKKGGLALILIVAVVAAGGGFMLPRLLVSDGKNAASEAKAAKPTILPFGDPIVVALGEERLTRYLRAKIILVIDGNNEKAVKEQIDKNKAFLKSWLIGYLCDLRLSEVQGAPGVNRLRREIRDEFNARLWPDGQELVLEVLFDEFVVQ